ncbi:MAG: hypothetical protein IPN76_07415 [Saprospiraceae bacterium]|nr:hypothetical protein [Saprospiraceae bacterium]
MTNRYLLFPVLGLAICLCCLQSCKKESIDNGDNGYPIQLTSEQDGRNVILKWTATKTADFQQYIVVRSSSPIPDDPTPTAQNIANLDDYKTSSFVDKFVPLSESVYYKVYVKMGDRFLFSPTVEVESDIKLLHIQPNRVLYDTEHHRVFLFDGNRNKLYRYNYETEKLEDSLFFSNTFDLRMALGNHGSGDELYLAPNNGSSDIKIYNPDNFDAITSINVGSFVYSIASGNNGFLYVSADNWQRSFSVYKRSTKQFVSGDSSFSGFGDSSVKVLSSDGFSVIQTASNQIIRHEINAQGQITDNNFTFIQTSFFGVLPNIVSSDDYQFFCFDIAGNVLNSDLDMVGTLSSAEFLFFNDVAFAADNSRVFGITNAGEFVEIGLSSFNVDKRASLGYSPLRIDRDGDKLLVVGLVFDNFGFAKTIVDELDIE